MPLRRAAAAPDPNVPLPQFSRQNITAALVIAILSAGDLACILYAPRWPIPCAIAGLFITAFAAVLHISLVTNTMTIPTVRIVGAASATVEPMTDAIAKSAEPAIMVQGDTIVAVNGVPRSPQGEPPKRPMETTIVP